jgi:CRISPR-associated endonuclease/helicase Cas3
MARPLPKHLEEIRYAQDNARRVLNEWKVNEGNRSFELSDPKQMEQFFKYHFFARANEMDYPVKSPPAPRDDTLLRMLGENGMAVDYAKSDGVTRSGWMQSFASAAQAFRAIDSQTLGVVVPYRKGGIDLIADLSAAHDLASEFRLLRRAQLYSVNVFQREIECLKRNDALYEAQADTSVFCLREQFYSNEFGLSLEGNETMESAIA